MSMTKKELAEVEELKTKLSLRFYPKILPDVKIPEKYSDIVNGYSFNAYSKRVEKSCTSQNAHGYGQWDKTTSQQKIVLYSNEKLAWQAMLHDLAKMFARELRDVEKRMEESQSESTAHGTIKALPFYS